MKRPLVPVACAYAAGLLLAEFSQIPLLLLFGTALGLWVIALAWKSQRALWLWPLLILIGWVNLTSRTAIISPIDLRVVMGTNAALATVRGKSVETPSQRVFEREETEVWRSLAEVEVHEIKTNDTWVRVTGKVMTSTPGILPREFFAGQPVEISGVFTPPATPVAEGLFDYRSYLRRHGIYYQLKAGATNDWVLGPGARTTLPLSDRFLTWAQQTLAHGLPETARDQPLRLLWAMTLGWRPALTDEVSEPFMLSGTMHIFAISGLHVALISGILVGLLRFARVPRAWCGWVIIPLIWFYTAATGWQPSAVRSSVMMTIVILGWALRRPSDLMNSLMAAALLILFWDPQQLFQASFQLSFFVVLSIALLVPRLEKHFNRLIAYDPLLPPALIPKWKQWLHVPMLWAARSAAITLGAWLGALPLTAYYFHLVSPVTLLANLVVVPASSAALACNMASLIFGDWAPGITGIFNHAGWACMWFMVWASNAATTIPGGYFFVPAPGLLEMMLYYGLLIGTMSGWLFAKARWKWSAGCIGVIAVAYFAHWQSRQDRIELTVLPLHGAYAVRLDAPGRDNDWLIDCGNTNSVEFVTKPYLRAQGVNRLPKVALTHGDLRYIGGLSLLETQFDVQQVFTSPIRFRSPTYRRIFSELETQPTRHRIISGGTNIGPWRVLHPQPDDKFSQADDSTLVLLGHFHGTRVLLLSDLGRPGQEKLMERETDLRADIVITGLPEQGEPLSDALLERIQPKLIIVADSENPATRRATPLLRERLAPDDHEVIYTRFTGAATLTFDRNHWALETMN